MSCILRPQRRLLLRMKLLWGVPDQTTTGSLSAWILKPAWIFQKASQVFLLRRTYHPHDARLCVKVDRNNARNSILT